MAGGRFRATLNQAHDARCRSRNLCPMRTGMYHACPTRSLMIPRQLGTGRTTVIRTWINVGHADVESDTPYYSAPSDGQLTTRSRCPPADPAARRGRSVPDGPYGDWPVDDTIWTLVPAARRWLDAANGADDAELTCRMLKVAEEAGEVASAWIGHARAEPPQGRHPHPRGRRAELADVVITALVAIESLGLDARATLEATAAKVHGPDRQPRAARPRASGGTGPRRRVPTASAGRRCRASPRAVVVDRQRAGQHRLGR